MTKALHKIKSAPTAKVKALTLRPHVKRIIRALGRETYPVTDESMVLDFNPQDIDLEEVEKLLGVEVEPDDFIYEIAERIIASSIN